VSTNLARVETGVPGLDLILHGGLPANRLHLIQGSPGTGKTTFALQFLREGLARGEKVLYVTLSETADELRDAGSSHGWDLDQVPMFELSAAEQLVSMDLEQTVFPSSEVELTETMKELLEELKEQKPSRVIFDTLSEIRLLAGEALRYRKQILLFKQFLSDWDCTVLFLEDDLEAGKEIQSMVTGVIELENYTPEFGSNRRRMRVIKMRGTNYLSGYHDFAILDQGAVIYPRLVAAESRQSFEDRRVSTGHSGLDGMLGGGLDGGTSVLLTGPAGSGKSTLVAQIFAAAAARGEKCALFMFDERPQTLLARTKTLGIPLEESIDSGVIAVRQVDPAELSPGELASAVQDAVEAGARFICIDSIVGYLYSMPGQHHLILQLHELLSFLGQAGVITLLVLGQMSHDAGLLSPVDLSYLADTVIQAGVADSPSGRQRTLFVYKRRSGEHEDWPRRFSIGKGGIQLNTEDESADGSFSRVATG
jgi:circadian clock protein KaiC